MENYDFLPEGDQSDFDQPNTLDWQVDDMLDGETGGSTTYWAIIDPTPVQDQGQSMACSAFASAHILSLQNYYEYYNIGSLIPDSYLVKWFDLWAKFKARGASDTRGYSNSGALQSLKALGLISGYAQCNQVTAMEKAIDNGNYILTGTNTSPHFSLRADHTMIFWARGYGHFFTIYAYDQVKEIFHAKNSFWTKWWNKGYFAIRYSDILHLFTRYAIFGIDEASKTLVAIQKDDIAKKMWQRALQLEIVSQNTPEMRITRLEASLIISKAIPAQMLTIPFWNNKERPSHPATRFECTEMLRKATGRDPIIWSGERPNETMLRREFIALLFKNHFISF